MDIDSSQPLLSYPVVGERGHEVERSGRGVDERRARNSDFASQCCSTTEIVWQWSYASGRINVMSLPKRARRRVIRVHSVNTVVFGSQNDYVVSATSDRQVR